MGVIVMKLKGKNKHIRQDYEGLVEGFEGFVAKRSVPVPEVCILKYERAKGLDKLLSNFTPARFIPETIHLN